MIIVCCPARNLLSLTSDLRTPLGHVTDFTPCPRLPRPARKIWPRSHHWESRLFILPSRAPTGRAGLGPCHLSAGHGTVFRHDPNYGTTRNILDRDCTKRTRGPCRAQDLGTAGYMGRPASWTVLGPVRHENST